MRSAFISGLILLAFACDGGADVTPGSSSGGGSSGASGSSGSSGASGSSGSSGAVVDGGSSGMTDPPDNGLIPQNSNWRSTSEWYRNIESAPVAEHSSEMIGALLNWGNSPNFQIDFSFSVLDGAGGSPAMFPPGEEADSVPVPIPAKGYVEGGYAYDACPVPDQDCHLLIVDRSANKLFEVYQARKNGAAWVGGLAYWQLTKPYPRSGRGQGCTSADAAGLAITPGLIGYKETKANTLRHALRFIIRNNYIRVGGRTARNVAYPASHGTFAGQAPKGLPYGARLRLKSSISETDPRFKSPGAKAIVGALRKYGMILSDGGNIPLVAESDQIYKDADPTQTWEGILAPRDLGTIAPSDFEVIGIPKDRPGGAPGYFTTKAEYEADLKLPLECNGIVQP
jgi:hypothetical protein